MPFGVVSRVGRGMGVLDGVVVEGKGAVLGVNLGRPVVTNGAFATRLIPNYFGISSDSTVLACEVARGGPYDKPCLVADRQRVIDV